MGRTGLRKDSTGKEQAKDRGKDRPKEAQGQGKNRPRKGHGQAKNRRKTISGREHLNFVYHNCRIIKEHLTFTVAFHCR
jgi:hypothetical protein